MSPWTEFVKSTYYEIKKQDPSAKLGDAMKKASKLWKSRKSGMGSTDMMKSVKSSKSKSSKSKSSKSKSRKTKSRKTMKRR